MYVVPSLIANTQPTQLVQPGNRTLHWPPVDAQPAAMAGQTLCQDGLNSQGAQSSPMRFRVIGSVTLDSVWPTTWPTDFAPNPRNGSHQGQQLGHIMTVCFGQKSGQGESIGVSNQVVLAPRFAPVRGIGSRFFPHRQPLGWTRYPPGLGTNQSGRPLAVWTAEVHEASAKPQPPASHEADASNSCPSRTPSPGVASARGCRSSARTRSQSTLAGRSKAFDLDSVVCEAWALAAKAESVPIIYHLPVAFPSASPPSQREATTNQASRTKPNQFILLPVLSLQLRLLHAWMLVSTSGPNF